MKWCSSSSSTCCYYYYGYIIHVLILKKNADIWTPVIITISAILIVFYFIGKCRATFESIRRDVIASREELRRGENQYNNNNKGETKIC